MLKPLLGKHTNKNDICKTFCADGINTSDSKNIASGFCKYCANVGSSLANQIPESTISPPSYFERKENSFFSGPNRSNWGTWRHKKSEAQAICRHDGLSCTLIKEIGYEICVPVSILINKSLSLGIVPDELKIAEVIPIFQHNEQNLFKNYRPISLLPTVSKIYDKLYIKECTFF